LLAAFALWGGLTGIGLAELIVHYTFDGDFGTTAADAAAAAGGDNFGTIDTTSSFTSDILRGDVLATGGTGGLDIDSLSSATGSYTIASWYKGTDSGYFYDQATNRIVASVEEYTTNSGEGTERGLGFWDGAWKNSAETEANDGYWHHLVWVLDGGTGEFSTYVDGVAIDVDVVTPGVQTSRPATWTTLGDGVARFFAHNAASGAVLTGLADDVRIYDNALTSGEVAALYADTVHLGITGITPTNVASADPAGNLVASFTKDIALKPGGTITLTDLDDGTGTTVITLPDPQVSVSGGQLIIDPGSDLEAANYEVVIDASAIADTTVTPETFAGTAPGQWVFSTATLQTGPTVKEVAGNGVIDSETLTTSGGTATLDGQIGSNWVTEGGNGGGAPQAFSSLTSPTVTIPTTGPVTLSFFHRYNFEADYDGGAVFVSVNGEPATYVEPIAFTQNGYVGTVNNTVWTGGESIFHGQSAGFGWPALIRSAANLGTLNAGDTVAVEFRGGWDANTYPAGPNWEIGSVTIQHSAGSALLDVDFSTAGTAGFTAVTTAVNPTFPGGWEYANVQHTFEIDADALTTDRYAPDVPGSVIDLNGANIVVKLVTGTLDAGDEFVLFDLSGGTTLTGSIGSLTLPPGVWDSSTLAVDGRIILLLPEQAALTTAGADLLIDASRDTDLLDGRSPDLVPGNPTGFDLVLDDSPAVTQVSFTGSAALPKIQSAFDMPGGATGNDAGAHLSTAGAANNQRSFHEAPGDWSNEDVTIEIWFKPDSLTPVSAASTNGQILFEDGGGTGLGFFLDDSGEIQMRKAPGSGLVAYDLGSDPSTLLLAGATEEFIQVTGTYDVSAGVMEMFVNGTSVGTAAPGGNDWSGGDGAGIGTRGDANVGGIGSGQASTETLDGQVAIFRAYRNQILTEAEVAANFTEITIADTTPATYASLSPANLTTGVFFEDNLVASFTESIALTGAGSVTLRNLDTMTDTVIPLPDGQVSVVGNQLTIDPSPALAFGTHYAVLISSDAIVDTAATPNAFVGISDPTRWTFTTEAQDFTDPSITTRSPNVGATGVQSLDSLVVTFDEPVVIIGGDLTLKNLTAATETTIALTDPSQVSLAGNVLTISPTSTLQSGSNYAVRIAGGAIADTSGNTFDGILDDTAWNFATGVFPNVLFIDTFNRPDSADLNESAAGKGGLLGPLNWGSGSLASLIDINSNAMRINNNSTPGNDGSWAWLEHNFSGLSEFTVSLDISAQNSAGDGRLTGFRVGQTLADISGEADAATVGNVADVAVYLDNIGGTRGIKVFEGATDLGYVATTTGVGVLSATFTCEDTVAGKALNYEVFLNGVSQYSGSTTWSGTDENYLSVQSNSSDDTRFDRFVVTGVIATSDYDAWADLYPGTDLSDPDADFDGDGVTNGDERLFGLNPTDSASVSPIVVPFDRETGTFSFTRRDNALTGLFTDIETSFDLEMWTVDAGAIVDDSAGPDANGIETVGVTLSPGLVDAPSLFLRVNQNNGLIFSENFENGDGGFIPTGSPNDWEYGTPNSYNNFDLEIIAGNGGSANCWGTILGVGGTAPFGLITPSSNSILRSPNISLVGAAGAVLNFAAAVDVAAGDTLEVLVREVGTDNPIAAFTPIAVPTTSSWSNYGPLDISAGAGLDVYLEFRFQGGNGAYLGFYIDDVTVRKTNP